MIRLAFYHGSGNAADALIRWVTKSKYSHVEIIDRSADTPDGGKFIDTAWSASYRDGGVRRAVITFTPDKWLVVPALWAPDGVIETISAQAGKPYDYIGLIGSQLLNLRRQRQNRWFCSELCAYALGLSVPQEMSPGGLYRRVLEMNRAYITGRNGAGEPPEE